MIEHDEDSTRHFGLAAFLIYVLGNDAHLATIKLERGFEYVFADDGSVQQSANAFFSSEGAAVANALQLLECSRDLKTTIRRAELNNGLWQRE